MNNWPYYCQKKTCIFLTGDDYEHLINEISDLIYPVSVEYDMEGISYNIEYPRDVEYDEIVEDFDPIALLSKAFGVEVTSIHIDDCDVVGVWICYKETE